MREAICVRICSKGGVGERRLTEIPAVTRQTSFFGRGGAGVVRARAAHRDDGDDMAAAPRTAPAAVAGHHDLAAGSTASRKRPARTPPPRRCSGSAAGHRPGP